MEKMMVKKGRKKEGVLVIAYYQLIKGACWWQIGYSNSEPANASWHAFHLNLIVPNYVRVPNSQ
jgi:hypothetical protein